MPYNINYTLFPAISQYQKGIFLQSVKFLSKATKNGIAALPLINKCYPSGNCPEALPMPAILCTDRKKAAEAAPMNYLLYTTAITVILSLLPFSRALSTSRWSLDFRLFGSSSISSVSSTET